MHESNEQVFKSLGSCHSVSSHANILPPPPDDDDDDDAMIDGDDDDDDKAVLRG